MSTQFFMRAALGAFVILSTAAADAQTLAQRIGQVRDGVVRMSFASRDGVCGDGKDAIRMGNQIFVSSGTTFISGHGTFGRDRERDCRPGPVRVMLTKRGGEVVGVKTSVSGEWRTSEGVDLGTVSAPEAAKYFLTLAPLSMDRSNKQAVLPAVLADSAVVWPELLRIAKTPTYDTKVRARMLHWVGITGQAASVAPLDSIAGDERSAPSMQDAAINALAELPDDLGLTPLIAIANGRGNVSARKQAVFWLGQSESAEARRIVFALVRREDTPDEVRGQGIFALGQGGDANDMRQLRELFPTLKTRKLKDRVLHAASESDDAESKRWLIAVAQDKSEETDVRKQAMFWAGQGDASIAELLGLWSKVEEPSLREHLLFVYSQRDESQATDKLMDVVKADPDVSVRKKALFWLGQKNDVSIRTLVDLWPKLTDHAMREQLLFVYSQRDESEATDKLISVAKSDADASLRKKALFWLGQKDSEKAAKFIREVLDP